MNPMTHPAVSVKFSVVSAYSTRPFSSSPTQVLDVRFAVSAKKYFWPPNRTRPRAYDRLNYYLSNTFCFVSIGPSFQEVAVDLSRWQMKPRKPHVGPNEPALRAYYQAEHSLSNTFRFVLMGPSFWDVAVDLSRCDTCTKNIRSTTQSWHTLQGEQISFQCTQVRVDRYQFFGSMCRLVAMPIVGTCAKNTALLSHVPRLIVSVISDVFWSMNERHRGSTYHLACVAARAQTTH